MRRLAILGAVLGALATSCGEGAPTEVRYFDPYLEFTVDLPAERLPTVQEFGPQEVEGVGPILSGMVATEPAQAQSGQDLFGGAPQQQDVAEVIQVAVIGEGAYASADDMVGLHIATETADLKFREPLQLAGVDAVLVVTDHRAQGQDLASMASVFAVDGDRAYWIMHIFPFGTWEEHRPTLYDVVNSFRVGVPLSVQLEAGPA